MNPSTKYKWPSTWQLSWAVLLLIATAACKPLAAPNTPLPPIQQPKIDSSASTPIVIQPLPASPLAMPTVTIPAAVTPSATFMPSGSREPSPIPVPLDSTPSREKSHTITLDPPRNLAALSASAPLTYTAFDFLTDYFTNQSYPLLLNGKPWDNGTINVSEYQKARQGVSYWDFISEHENWDSPSYMWQDDDGQWRPYDRVSIDNAAGYVLLDRKGPGVMDKLWFTEDAVWMLTTEQSKLDVGPIASMEQFVEWGNLDKLGKLRVEVDDHIAYDGPVRDWLDGTAWGLTPELAQVLTWRHREYGSSGAMLPVLYQKHLRITVYGGSKKPKWFLATGMRLSGSVSLQPYTGSRTDLPLDTMARLVRTILAPEEYITGQGDVRAFDLTVVPSSASTVQFHGSGTVTALQFRIPRNIDPRQFWWRVKYDNDIAIDLSLIAFFGDQKVLVPHRSTPLGVVESDGEYLLYSNLPMPFQSGMTFELMTNGSTPVHVSCRMAVSGQVSSTQLRVDYRPGEKLQMYGPDYQAHLPGDGKLVGLLLESEDQGIETIPKIYVEGKPGIEDPVKRAWPLGYLEGNLTLADGNGDNRIFGGQEDWADGGFYFNRGYTSPPGGSNRPFGGILRYQDGNDGYATIFRYFNDLSAFQYKKGLTLSFGHGTFENNFPVRYGTTVYYYRQN